jgi:F1F0 ATPase subunit 2
MDAPAMSAPAINLIWQSCLGLAVGIALGFIHFRSLWWNTRMFAQPGSILTAFAVQIGRFGLLVAVFVVLAKLGAVALLSGALGLLIARQVVIKRLGTVA